MKTSSREESNPRSSPYLFTGASTEQEEVVIHPKLTEGPLDPSVGETLDLEIRNGQIDPIINNIDTNVGQY